MASTIIKEILGVRQFLGDPLDQAPSTRQIEKELEVEYQQLTNKVNNRGQSQHIGEMVIETVQGQRRYEIDAEGGLFYKALGLTTIPAGAVIAGDYPDLTVTVSGGDDREQNLEFVELERFNDEWSFLAPNRGQLFSSSHDAQMVAFYKTISGGAGEKTYIEFRPTPNSVQKYLLLYQLTDWWDTIFEASSAGVMDDTFVLPHSSQRMMIRCVAGMNLVQKGVVKWALNDEYNAKRGEVVLRGLQDRYARYKQDYEDYLDELEHGDVVYVELYGDRL